MNPTIQWVLVWAPNSIANGNNLLQHLASKSGAMFLPLTKIPEGEKVNNVKRESPQRLYKSARPDTDE